MIYIEMSRDETHGGGTWGFTNCLWAPSRKENGSKWAFWEKILNIKEGDIIFHLRGKRPDATFVGYSFASSNGIETTQRPPDPKEWAYAKTFYRVDLANFTPFHTPINLDLIFREKAKELENYFLRNKEKKQEKLNLFFVKQKGRLQCFNGGYLSDVDQELFSLLFQNEESIPEKETTAITSVQTRTQIAVINARIGQNKFSKEIKASYGNHCCFPGCNISDSRFLVGSHIARWSDNEELRGDLNNGLCLCVLHDKAFELGLFTLDENYKIYINPKERVSNSEVFNMIETHQGKTISIPKNHPPSLDALLEHWIRTGIDPI